MNDQATLHAGGIVPTGSKLGDTDVVDTVVARAYAHPVLPGRVVVRLCAEGVAAGDELEMATLGFAAGAVRGAVGKQRKRPLGFPGWALVNDPKNARFALDVVKELKKHARKAKSKPGHAKEAFDAIATKLGKTVPHFLPSFYEEVGRVFIEHGAITYAAAMFGKARQVEAVHALEVDEQHRIDGFLEFALAGAVTTKALSEYGKELSQHHEPKLAYAHFRQLCVQRTLGGMPPWSGMSKDLGRLAKAAKLDVAREDAALIAEIIEAPALAKAAGEFWRAYAGPITALAKANPSVRGVLLNLFPTGSSHSTELDDVWLDLLESTGAVDALIGGGHPDAQPTNGRAAWFDKLCVHVARSWRSQTIPARVFGLLRRMAAALIADGKPIKVSTRYRLDLDLAELALELGIAVESPDRVADGTQWASTAHLPEHGRDPVRCAAHPTLAETLRGVVIASIGNPPFDTASGGKQGFLDAKRQWLEGQIAEAERAALPALDTVLGTIEQKVSAGTFAELPELHARFAAIDVAPALARTLRVGIIDELGWPLLEEVALELNPDGKTTLVLHGAPSAVIVASKTRGIAIAGDRRLGVHDFVVPPKHELVTTRFIGDQFLVVLKESYRVKCYWSNAPHDLWEAADANHWSIQTSISYVAVLPDGAWLEARKPMRAGDRTLVLGTGISAWDGTTGWVSEWVNAEYRWRELTASGELGRQSWPSWIEGAADADWRIDGSSYYFPAPAGITSSPLGIVDGFIGSRIRWRGSHHYRPERREVETIDGAKVACAGHLQIRDLLALPDGGDRRPLGHEAVSGKGTALVIFDPTATFAGSKFGAGDRRYGHGQVTTMTSAFLHLYSARDVAGSRRIHAATDDDARALIAAAPAITVDQPVPEDLPGLLPEVTHPRLRKGVAGLAVMTAQQQARRDKLAAERAPGRAQATGSIGPDDKTLLAALPGWIRQQWAPAGSAWAQIERTGAVFADPDRSDRTIRDLGTTPADWMEVAVLRSSLAMLAVAIGTSAEHRAVVAKLYEHVTRTLPPADKLRVLHMRGALPGEDSAQSQFQIRWIAGNAYAIRQWGYRGEHYHILEYAPDGKFQLLGVLALDRELRGTAGGPAPEEVHAAVAAGQTSWSPETAARLAAETGLTPSEAAYLWAGCPCSNDRGANFLDKTLREQLGLKAAQAALARDALTIAKFESKLAAFDEAGRAGLAALLDGSAVSRFAAAWKARFGERIAVPEALIAKADAQNLSSNVPGILSMVFGGVDSPQLTVDGCYAFDDNGTLIRAGKTEPLIGQTKLADDSPHFDYSTLAMIVAYLPFLYGALPVGDPLRSRAVSAYELALERVKQPGLWLTAAAAWLDKDKFEALDRVLTSLGGELLPVPGEGRAFRRLPGGAVMRAGTSVSIFIRPSELDARARALLEPLTQQVNSYMSAGKELDYLRGPELRTMMQRITDTPVPPGSWEQNPIASVPKLVEKVAKKLKLERDAAALYLQYLVLLWPTPKALAEYNDWKPQRLAAARAELVDQALLLEAKRERAQRGHFLPGGWEAQRAPHAPLETWKLPFYGYRTPEGVVRAKLGKDQATEAFHVLFERAWKRIEDGDEPRYEEVKR